LLIEEQTVNAANPQLNDESKSVDYNLSEVYEEVEEEKLPLLPSDYSRSLPALASTEDVKRMYRLASKWSLDLSAEVVIENASSMTRGVRQAPAK